MAHEKETPIVTEQEQARQKLIQLRMNLINAERERDAAFKDQPNIADPDLSVEELACRMVDYETKVMLAEAKVQRTHEAYAEAIQAYAKGNG